jgi:purine nucleosidase
MVERAKRVIIDCDVGVDDALALILAFHSPALKVEAVTGVNGNVPLERVYENIRKVLTLIQPSNKPWIAKGASQPLKGKAVYAHSVHGADGLGGARIGIKQGDVPWQEFSGPAGELILKMAAESPGEFVLIATGPLTNVAVALQKDPQGMKKLKEVIIMGGAVRVSGNVTPHAEFNIFVDPAAAKIVFESGLRITLVPLDVTHQVSLTPDLMEERVRPLNNPFSKFTIKVTGYDTKTRRFARSPERIHLHDPLAVGVAIDPKIVRTERISLTVETREGDSFGKLSEAGEGPKINVCLGVESGKFLNLFLSSLR